MKRRSLPSALTHVDAPRWLRVLTLASEPIEARELPPGADLRAELQRQVDRMRAEGWEPEGGIDWGSVFMRRGHQRVEVRVSASPPGAPVNLPQPKFWGD